MFFTSTYLRPLTTDQLQRSCPALYADHRNYDKTSDKYLFIPTSKIISGLESEGWRVVSAQNQRGRSLDARQTGKHAILLARHDMLAKQSDFGVGDTFPLIRIDNSHNGLSSFQISLALFRKACANGLTVPDSMLATAPKVRHSVNIDRDVIEASYKIIQDAPKLLENVNLMKSIQLDSHEKLIFAESASPIIFDKEVINVTNQVMPTKQFRNRWGQTISTDMSIEAQILNPKRTQDRASDLWTTLNVIQENAIRGGVQIVNPETKAISTARKVSSIDRDKEINTSLMILASKMAELKGVKLVA